MLGTADTGRLRLVLALIATLAVVGPIGVLWQQSRVPSTYSVAELGDLDLGGGPGPVADGSHAG
ncbi:MAG: multicopper oxidase family protein, partial [Nocardioidaceae bacterium]